MLYPLHHGLSSVNMFPKSMKHPSNFINRIGKRYGRLKVISEAGFSQSHQRTFWNCICQCGKACKVQGKLLGNGTTKSCGCLSSELTGTRSRTHGFSKAPEYFTYHRMKKRCCDKRCPDYPDYGGRGISICRRWQSFENFLKDMGLKPSPRHSIERKNVNGNYTPSNCKWGTPKEQASNRRSTRLLTFRGEACTMTEWGRRFNLDHTTIRRRINAGWSVKSALLTPSHRRK